MTAQNHDSELLRTQGFQALQALHNLWHRLEPHGIPHLKTGLFFQIGGKENKPDAGLFHEVKISSFIKFLNT